MSFFLEDDPEIAAFGEDLAWPLALDGNGDLAIVSGEDNLLSALPIRAATELGEVPTSPRDGVDMTDMQNGLADDIERASFAARLIEQYRRDDRLDSVTVDVVDGESDGETIAQIAATTRTGVLLDTVEVPFGST